MSGLLAIGGMFLVLVMVRAALRGEIAPRRDLQSVIVAEPVAQRRTGGIGGRGKSKR